jgi:hypothetical protein
MAQSEINRTMLTIFMLKLIKSNVNTYMIMVSEIICPWKKKKRKQNKEQLKMYVVKKLSVEVDEKS